MKKIYKIALILFSLGLIGGIGVYFYVFHSKHKDTFKLEAKYKVTAEDLFKQFETNEDSANAKYLENIIEVDGKILSIKEYSGSYQVSFIDEVEGVTCMIDSNYAVQQKADILKLKAGDEVRIKGQCNGFLTGVQLDRCVIAKDE